MRVFLADDHPLLRIGLRISLEQEEDIDVIGEASDGYTAVTRIGANLPDISLIDLDMPGMSGIKAIRVLRNSGFKTKLVVLSCYNDENYVRDAMEAGADGYILKCIEVSELVRIMRSFYTGQPTVSPYLVNLTLPNENNRDDPDTGDAFLLTVREKQILKGIAEGKSNKEISASLNISVETVKTHIKKIYDKLNVRGRVDAVRAAMNMNILQA